MTNDDPLDATVSSGGGGNLADSATSASTARKLPTEIGGYRIVGLLGEGGMGVVYEAEQPSPRRNVALKVVRGTELVDDLRLKMFEREAATLARLDHPNIGRIFESGRTAEGRHFFAMELVRGPSLGAWLAKRSATPDRAEIELRLRLFEQICDAVHYAHQRGVIHRDLKPSNVIVPDAPDSDAGTETRAASLVKILDFGLARMTEEDVAATQITEIGVIKGTIPYMAPEQARGEVAAIDVRTDVYALGVILYELLTRQRPYSTDTGSLLSAVRVICETTPRPLAEVWTGTSRLDPDLSTIVAKALAKEPDQRYASAAAFGEDVERFLTSQPIQARPPSTMYQFKKLVARRKPLFATAAAALVLVIAAAIGMAALYVRSEANLVRAVEAEKTARREAETAERTSTFLVDLFDRANPERTRGESVTAREVMDEGARSVETELAGEPLMQARLLHTISTVYKSLGLYDDARRAIDKAVALRRANLPAGDPALAASLNQLGATQDAQGDPKAARASFEETKKIYEALGPEETKGLIEVLGNESTMFSEMGEFAAANDAVRRALALAEGSSPPDEERILQVLINWGNLRQDEGRPDSALTLLSRGEEIARRLHGDSNADLARVLTNMGVCQASMGKFDEASKSSSAALAIYKKIYGDTHPTIVKELGNVGIYLAQQGKQKEGKPYFEEALAALKRIHGEEHPEVGRSYSNLGFLKLETGDAPGAIVDLERAVAIMRRTSGEKSPSLSNALYQLAGAKDAVGETEEAERLLVRVIAMDEEIYGVESGEIADDLEALAEIQRKRGNAAGADRSEARMNAIREKLKAASGE